MDLLHAFLIKIRLLIVLVAASLCSCAQSKYGIVRAHAYMQETTPGTVMQDDMRRGPDTLYRVYVETKTRRQIKWITASVGNQVYKIILSKATSPVFIGLSKETGDSAIVSAKKGNILWQLNLEKQEADRSLYPKNTGSRNAILLKLKSEKKVHNYKVSPIAVMQTEHYM